MSTAVVIKMRKTFLNMQKCNLQNLPRKLLTDKTTALLYTALFTFFYGKIYLAMYLHQLVILTYKILRL